MTEHTNLKKHRKIVMFLGNDFLLPYLDPRVYKEARSLVGEGFEVSVVCWQKRGEKLPVAEDYEGIKVYRIFQGMPHHKTPFLLRVPFYKLFVLKSIARSLRLKPDIVHCHDLDTLIIGVILKLLTGKPFIFDAHEDFPGMLEVAYPGWVSHLARFYERMLIKMADTVIAAEMPYVDVMEKHYRVSPVVVMNLPDLDNFHPEVDAAPVIRRYGLEGKTVISHIGIIGRERGIYETLEALQYLETKDFRYLLIGRSTDEEWDRIRETIKSFNLEDKVILLVNGVDHKEVPRYYKASDITMALLYPLPNYVTSLPTKLFESLAVGVPVLAGNLDYLSSVVNRYEVGLCADAKDPRDIAAKLNKMINDKQMRVRMGQNGLRVIREELNWSESARRLKQVYQDILAGG